METNQTNLSHLNNIRKLLIAGAKISVLSVMRILKTFECRHYIAILRKEGLKIADEWCKSENGKRYKIYWLQS